VAAALADEPNGEAVLSIHVATDGEAAGAVQEAAKAGGVVVKRPTTTPLGGSYACFGDPTGTCGRSSATRCTAWGRWRSQMS
jgi:predicted enzyme related to lactoylglutathione lyase